MATKLCQPGTTITLIILPLHGQVGASLHAHDWQATDDQWRSPVATATGKGLQQPAQGIMVGRGQPAGEGGGKVCSAGGGLQDYTMREEDVAGGWCL